MKMLYFYAYSAFHYYTKSLMVKTQCKRWVDGRKNNSCNANFPYKNGGAAGGGEGGRPGRVM